MAAQLKSTVAPGTRRSLAHKPLRAAFGRQTLRVTAKAAVKATTKTANMVCLDCGYIYDGKKGPFEKLPGSYSCPVCGANKKRFRAFEGNVSKANDSKTMSARRDALVEQLEARGENTEDGGFLLTTALSTGAFLAAVYYFTVLAR